MSAYFLVAWYTWGYNLQHGANDGYGFVCPFALLVLEKPASVWGFWFFLVIRDNSLKLYKEAGDN